MTGGHAGQAGEARINSAQMRSKLADLRIQFDYAFICMPAASPYGEAASLATLTDGVVLVLRANFTRRESARRIRDEFQTTGVSVLGAVLIDRVFPIPEAVYFRL
jgi:Mrp family chromosome partitioning ATPase